MEGSEGLRRSGADAIAIEAAELPEALAPEARSLLPQGLGGWLGAALSVALFAGTGFFLGRIIVNLRAEEFVAALEATSAQSLLLACAATLASYTALLGYDLLALHVLGRRLPLSVTSLASLAGNAFSFTLGFPLLTEGRDPLLGLRQGGSLRARGRDDHALCDAHLLARHGGARRARARLRRGLARNDRSPTLAGECRGPRPLARPGALRLRRFHLRQTRVLRLFGSSLKFAGPRVFPGPARGWDRRFRRRGRDNLCASSARSPDDPDPWR